LLASPVEIKNRVTASQVQFPQFRAIKSFFVESGKQAQWSWVTLVRVCKLFIDRTFRASVSSFSA